MNFPTSLIVVLLIAAWLVVLVPMVARRREHVPETEAQGGTFRVLRRASASLRRRPNLNRRAQSDSGRDTLDVDSHYGDGDDGDSRDGELTHGSTPYDPMAGRTTEAEQATRDQLVNVEMAHRRSTLVRTRGADGRGGEIADDFGRHSPEHDDPDDTGDEGRLEDELVDQDVEFDDDDDDADADADAYRDDAYLDDDVADGHPVEAVPPVVPVGRGGSSPFHGRDRQDLGATLDPRVSGQVRPSRSGVRSMSEQFPADELVDESRLRPIPQRPGRGGFDPDAAEAARAYKFARRRRVALVLVALTLGFALAAYFLAPVLWTAAGVCGLLLVAYFGYLRRQVRIEEEIRHRRLARLRRARQIRPEYSHHLESAAPAGEPFAGDRAARTPAAVSYRGRQVVDLDDDDPSFDDLDYYQPVAYRRASGQ